MKIVALLCWLAVAFAAGFGFLATFEPLEPSTQLGWRIGFGAVGLGALGAFLWTLRAGRTPAP